MKKRRGKVFSRRDFLRVVGMGAGAMVLKGCSPKALADWLVATPIVPPTPLLMPTTAPTQPPTATPTSTPSPTGTSTPAPFPTWTPSPSPSPSPTPGATLLHDFQVPAAG